MGAGSAMGEGNACSGETRRGSAGNWAAAVCRQRARRGPQNNASMRGRRSAHRTTWRRRGLPERVDLQVAPFLHIRHPVVVPRVEVERTNLGKVSAEVAVDARALEADEGTEVDGGPCILRNCSRMITSTRTRMETEQPVRTLMQEKLAACRFLGRDLRFAGQSAQVMFPACFTSAMSFFLLRAVSLSSAL